MKNLRFNSTPRRLSKVLAIGVAVAPLSAIAGDVDGSSHTVNPGDPAESWVVSNGGQLIVMPGAETGQIEAENSLISLKGALLTHTAFNEFSIALRGTSASVADSTISSTGAGIYAIDDSALSLSNSAINVGDFGIFAAGNATVSVSNSRVSTTTARTSFSAAIYSEGRPVDLTNGSIVTGAQAGVLFSLAEDSWVGDGNLLVDASTIEGGAGAAVVVQRDGSAAPAGHEVRILVRNGAQLKGGNGDLLFVDDGAFGSAPVANLTVETTTLNGNVTAEEATTANVTLGNEGRINGIFNSVNQATITGGGYWQLTGGSTVDTLNLRAGGSVELGDGRVFNTLSVSGNFAGDGGTLLFNGVLAGDDAASDKLVVAGDTSGQTNVRVRNVNGTGAQTNRGIELISVAGASNGQFDLAGRVVGGQFEYSLIKDAGNWYLRSQLVTQPNPCDTNPALPGCPSVTPPVNPGPVLRPESGAYVANMRISTGMFRAGYRERASGQNSSRGWVRVDGSRNSYDAVSRQLDVHGNSQALSVGANMLGNDSGSALGVTLSTGNASSTSTNALTGYYARGRVKGEALGLYGTWRAAHEDPYAGFYVDGTLYRARFHNRLEGIGLAAERYDSRMWQGAVETGYAFRMSSSSDGGMYFEPQLQVGYSLWDDLRHTEANGTVVVTRDVDGLFGRVGFRISGVNRAAGASEVQPYMALHWLHTRASSQIRMNEETVDSRVPRSRVELSAGASLRFASGWGAWAGLARQEAGGFHQTSGQLGVGYSW